MEVAQMDMMIRATREELARKQMEIVNKYKTLKSTIQDNELLVDVLDDYSNYCDNLVSNKQRQVDTLNILTQHLDKINHDSKNVDHVLKSTTEDYRLIMSEIRRIKKDLDSYGLNGEIN